MNRREVARTSAEEGDGLTRVFHQRPHAVHVPEVVLMDGAVEGFAGLRVALVGKLPVSVDRVVATTGQLVAHRGLARAGDALDQVVADTHRASIQDCAVCICCRADRGAMLSV